MFIDLNDLAFVYGAQAPKNFLENYGAEGR